MNLSDLFGVGDHLKRLSETDDPLEVRTRIIDVEAFQVWTMV